ncbi:AraC family transcriptional regulator [Roseibacillus ishigakijimensis]|uniref:Helix-turn-helix transcriptional regulator n=1 Tax=Roseibacillus ishigakijimensis TaxID=454146 RepID=A0A934VJG1_9BACT|nr:AraC family transcriptional regulator [Roseibacillus ishigakijimensis]MBK1832564.1 helix-turn-helix transcriptional regulator [Roseibacillus ishigakijimensis]
MERIGELVSQLGEPEDYFVGKDWGRLILPREILCFHRSNQMEEEGWGGISTSAKRYDQHRRFVLLVAREGSGRVGVETNLWNLQPGEALLMFPHQAHYYVSLPEKFSWLFVTFDLPLSFWSAIQPLRDSPRRLSKDMLATLYEFLSSWTEADDELGALQAASYLGGFLSELSGEEELPSLGVENELVRRVRERVQNNLREDLSVRAIADYLEVSGSYLREQFREGAGVSLGHFVRSVRLMEATRLLRDSSLSVREVAELSGFGSFTAFSRAFGNVYGTSPSVYRKTVGGGNVEDDRAGEEE